MDKNYKLIISDYDGTLSGNDHTITDKVGNSIRKWISSGKHFTIATGRQYLMIDEECKKWGIEAPVIVRGGAEVVNPINGEIIDKEYIGKEDLSKIIDFLKSKEMTFLIENDAVLYSNFKFPLTFPKITYKEISEFKLQDTPKIVVKANDDNYLYVNESMNYLSKNFKSIHVIDTFGRFGYGWDITSSKATKLHGIVKVLEYLGVKREETVGVGDSYNDFPLLEACSLKVAMGNAIEDLKAIADITVPSYEENGVAVLIEKLLDRIN